MAKISKKKNKRKTNKKKEEEKYTGIAGKISSKRSWTDWFGEGDYYFVYPDKIYVRNYELSDQASDKSNFSYFFIDAQIAAGSEKGKEIKRIQFEINIVPNAGNEPINIIKVVPDEKVKDHGSVSKKETIIVKQKAETGVEANASVPLGIINNKFGASGSLSYDKTKETISNFDYSPHVIVAQGRGVGTYAIWEFTRDESEPLRGQYAINVYFQIKKPHPPLSGTESYQALPKIIVNNRVIDTNEKDKPLVPIEIEFLK